MIYSLTALGNDGIVKFDYTCDRIIKRGETITILDKITNKSNMYLVGKVTEKNKLSSQQLETKRYAAENNKWMCRKIRWNKWKSNNKTQNHEN